MRFLHCYRLIFAKPNKFVRYQTKEKLHMISTVIDQALGLEFPIFQGGMAWVADASLAAGVSNAGGLGIIAAMNSNGEQLRERSKNARS